MSTLRVVMLVYGDSDNTRLEHIVEFCRRRDGPTYAKQVEGKYARERAEASFKSATTKRPDAPAQAPVLPGAKETVSLRLDRDVLDFFQESGAGWQERINEALRKVAGK
jgi:uncharacterized protein (DUF4415 family)